MGTFLSDAYSSSIGKYADSSFTGGGVKQGLIDPGKNHIIVIGETAISVYSYTKTAIGICTPLHASPTHSTLLTLHYVPSAGILIDYPTTSPFEATIFSAMGKLVRQLTSNAHAPLVWDRKDNAGAKVGNGCYLVVVNSKERSMMSAPVMVIR